MFSIVPVKKTNLPYMCQKISNIQVSKNSPDCIGLSLRQTNPCVVVVVVVIAPNSRAYWEGRGSMEEFEGNADYKRMVPLI